MRLRIYSVKTLNLIMLKWKEEEVIDGVEVRNVDGETKSKLSIGQPRKL